MLEIESPKIKNKMIDKRSGITYVVLAYRKLTPQEMLIHISDRKIQAKARKMKHGGTIVMRSLLGIENGPNR